MSEREQNDGSRRFRSVLPHEPLRIESPGYILVQGAFTPKRHKLGDSDEQQENEGLLLLEFWTLESLRYALIEKLNLVSSSASDLIDPISDVAIVDESPPFTKVRLECTSSEVAYRLCAIFRRRKVCPCSLFADMSVPGSFLVFGSRPVQLTQLTVQSLPRSDQAWNRSSPPKFRRLLPKPDEDPSVVEEERRQTRFVFISNLLAPVAEQQVECWSDHHLVTAAVRNLVTRYDTTGLGVEVYVSNNKLRHCHVGMRTSHDAQALISALQDAVVELTCVDPVTGQGHKAMSGRLFLDYAAITYRSVARAQARLEGRELERGEPPCPDCTSLTDHVTVPGLVVLPEFVSQEEEAILLAVLTGPQAPWAPSQSTPTTGRVVRRKVQHYGYVFDYQSANVLRDRNFPGADCPPMPGLSDDLRYSSDQNQLEEVVKRSIEHGDGWNVLAGVIERTRRFEFGFDSSTRQSFPDLNQLTVNLYRPGEGIGSHIDTPSAFGDGLISISLNGGIVMEFREVTATSDNASKKLVYLPPRSLVLMSGSARYEWEHMIVTRKTDTVNGKVLPRQLRVSLTLRTALTESGQPMPVVSSRSFPPVWGSVQNELLNPLVTPACERDHVHHVYDAIATQWHHTRGRRGVLWPGATQFLQRLPAGSIVADVGCGDGKYFPAIWEAGSYVIGTDISLPLLKTAMSSEMDNDIVPETRRVGDERHHLQERPAVAVADCMSVPLRTSSCDAAICIAVLHHISTPSRRRRCIEELARIVKPGGTINLQAWALEQEESSRHRFAANDIFVPFNVQPKYLPLGEKEIVNDESGRVNGETFDAPTKSTAQRYSEAFNADYDDQKGLVVFNRYCHLYKEGELESLCAEVPNVAVVDRGFESGNHFVILEVQS